MRALIRLFPALLTLFLLLRPAAAGETPAGAGPVTTPEAAWEISDAEVLSRGMGGKTPQGRLTAGYKVRADARYLGKDAPFEYAEFVMELQAFSPDKDLPGQKAGLWYLRGDWTLRDRDAPSSRKKVRYNPQVIRGKLVAETTVNPATESGAFEAPVIVPMASGSWGKGEGKFWGNEKFEGMLVLELERGPLITKTGRYTR